VGLAHIEATEILFQFRQFLATNAISVDAIQFGYDGDPFADPERGMMMLRQLTLMGKHVNISTKALLSDATVYALHTLHTQMRTQGTILSALVSLSCWDSAPHVEPHTPSPQGRMQTVARLSSYSIPVFIAVRPILPHLADEEYVQIVREGINAGCNGFILGPLYADDRGQFVRWIPAERLDTVDRHRCTVSWSPHAPTWTRYEDEARLQRLMALTKAQGGRVFLSSADVMTLVSQEQRAA
jgi:DNA repair photolyase